ncbi:MAG: AzlC family ABC transporter permease [Chloroflexota bacterium]
MLPLTRLSQFFAGVRAEAPILIGVMPFGMIYGVLAREAGIPAFQAQAVSAIVFAGSAQMVLTQLVHLGAPLLVMVLTLFVVNLRHALYSASVAPYIQHLSKGWKALLSYLLTDEAYAVAIIHYKYLDTLPAPAEPAGSSTGSRPEVRLAHWYFLGAGLALWSSWQLSTALGIALGAVVPQSWSLDFTLALTFIALVVPGLKDRPGWAAALTAGTVALLAYGLPYKLGLVLASVCGVATAALVDRWSGAPAGERAAP